MTLGVSPLLLWLGDPACHDAAVAGGKAANLSRLAERYPVPPGFCLTPATHALYAARQREMGAGDGSEPVPAEVVEWVEQALFELAARSEASDLVVAVRSSATDEDGGTASFAGQHDTYLNVRGAEAVAQAVTRCWSSARSSRALDYRRRQSLSVSDFQIAVLVQQLVPADVSGVVFGADPIGRDTSVTVINASWGLGESIVSGLVTPDTYVVRKDSLEIVSRRIADKRTMTIRASEGTREVDVPRILRSVPALTDDQIVETARVGVALESEMGWPSDVEFAYHGRSLYLLQCRPITTL